MNSTNILEIKNLTKKYHNINGEILSLDSINITLKEKEFLGIIGPSGCGKSTLLNILSGLDNEYSGNINKNNNIKIGYMLQDDTLFPWLTILDNALLGLKITKQLTNKTKEYTISLLKKYGLYEFINNYPSSLSGGMKQRVALIRTLALNPDILLLDEPYSALDYQNKLKIGMDVYNILKIEKKTAIIVTHDIDEAISMCDRIIVLTKRPAKIKSEHNIIFDNNQNPIENRKSKLFSYYHDIIWKEIEE